LRNLLDRARTVMRGWGPSAPVLAQPYHVVCPQGHPLRGVRTEGYQALRCPSCGAGIFVLPRSPLPLPAAPPMQSVPRHPVLEEDSGRDDLPIALTDPPTMQDVGDFEPTGEIEWMDSGPATEAGGLEGSDTAVEAPLPTRSPTAPSSPRPDSDRGQDVKEGQGATPTPARRRSTQPLGVGRPGRPAAVVGRPTVPVSPRVSWSERARQSRHKLLFVGVGLLVIGTIAFRAWRTSQRGLPEIATRGRTQGLEALEAGKFDTAHQLLSEASRAVDAMGGALEGAEDIRQGAREAAIYNNLVPESLESLLAEAGRSDPQEWASTFATLYKGRAIILDVHITSEPDGSQRLGHGLDYRIFQEGEGGRPMRVGRIDTAGLRIFELSGPKVGDHVQFGARLASFTFDPVTEEWRVGLEPDSGVEMMHKRALQAFGWPAPEDPPAEVGP